MLMAGEEDDDGAGLRGLLADAQSNYQKAERRLEDVCRLIGSAKIQIETVLAVQHLKRYRPDMLGMNIEANEHNALVSAIADIDKAVEAADLIPF